MTARSFYEVGHVLDQRYELRRVIGSGAEGVVYEAWHRYLHRPVALKTILADGGEPALKKRRQRILREARVLSELRHPGIVSVLDAGLTGEGHPYVAMELLEGKTLDGIVAARGRLPVADTLALLLELCETISTAHKRGVLHRDIKPSNVFIIRRPNGDEHTKLLDFGTSRAAPMFDTKLTDDGAIIGTPAYMSPEQLMGMDLDQRTDVYALAALFYECVTGRAVYPGNYGMILRAAYSPEPPPALGIPGLDQGLEAVVAKGLAKDREKRWPSVDAFAQALQHFVAAGTKIKLLQAESPTQRRRFERAPFLAPVGLRGPEGAVDGRCEDISEGGMLFLSRSEAVPGRIYDLRFGAPVSGRVALCRARAQWVRARPGHLGGWAVGLEFVDPPADLRADIALFVRLMKAPEVIEPEPESTTLIPDGTPSPRPVPPAPPTPKPMAAPPPLPVAAQRPVAPQVQFAQTHTKVTMADAPMSRVGGPPAKITLADSPMSRRGH
jgi:serine/threonine-protein kinase